MGAGALGSPGTGGLPLSQSPGWLPVVGGAEPGVPPRARVQVEPLALARAESRDALSAAAAPPKQELRGSPEPVGGTRQTEESQAKHAISSDREADYLHSCQSSAQPHTHAREGPLICLQALPSQRPQREGTAGRTTFRPPVPFADDLALGLVTGIRPAPGP